METSSESISMYGYVLLLDFSSRISASQTTRERTSCRPSFTFSSPRYVEIPPPRLIDFAVTTEDVWLAACTALAPVSCSWPFPENAMERTSPCAPSPMSQIEGYFIVRLAPMLPSTHSTMASLYAAARLVTRLYTSLDQFWIVV